MSGFTFKFEPAEDETVDSQYVLLEDGVDTRIVIQDCRSYGGGYSINRYSGTGADLGVTFLDETRSLVKAKEKAISLATAATEKPHG